MDMAGWQNNMESWKCGRHVAAFWCDTEAGAREGACETKGHGESAGGWSESQDTGLENAASLLLLVPVSPVDSRGVMATVFSETQCHGDSALVAGSSSDTELTLATGTEIKSVMFRGCDYEADEDCANRELFAKFYRNKGFVEGDDSRWNTMFEEMNNLQVKQGKKNRCYDIPVENNISTQWFTDRIGSLEFGHMD